MNIYESGEMYLENILEIRQKNGNVRSVDLVNTMGFAKSSVSEGIKNLKNNGYVEVGKDGLITLTEKGEEVAKHIFEKHTILTKAFIKLGVEPEIAEKDACKIEHIISDETFNAIKKHVK